MPAAASAASPLAGAIDSPCCGPYHDAVSSLQRTVLHWLASCVMEDRMHRIVALCSTGADVGVLARELSLQRDWAPSEHPQWLVFEVENTLQFRPEQC